MKILSIVGARPQFIKAASLSKELRKHFKEVLVHTGQHYDNEMSPIFFKELSIPKPDYNLGVGSGLHGEQTGKMLIEIEKVLLKENPDLVLVYGDTNSTIAGSLAAAKLHIKIGHVEAGLRSYNREMPEEINRVVTDHLSDLLFCPTRTAVDNLKKEGITKGVYLTGDVMYDAILENLKAAKTKSEILQKLNIKPKSYIYATVHRAENTDKENNLRDIIEAFSKTRETIILPIHPRTKKMLDKFNLVMPENVKVIDPVGYLDSLSLMSNARKIVTDSGGVQKEAYFLKIPCLTLRNKTEWVETVQDGWNTLTGASKEKILEAINEFEPKKAQSQHFGKGDAVQKIIDTIEEYFQ